LLLALLGCDHWVLQVGAAELKQGYDGLATANQQLAEDALGNKASFDKLQVGMPGYAEKH
jgi:hypothetical protein